MQDRGEVDPGRAIVRTVRPGHGPRRSLQAAVALALSAAGAAPAAGQGRAEWCPEPEAAQFDFWLGEWNVVSRNRPPGDGEWVTTGSATDRVYTAVGGCAVVEHWRGYAFPSAGHIVGFSVRAWEPGAREWRLVLLWPVAGPPAFVESRGVFADGRGLFTRSFTSPAGDSLLGGLRFDAIESDAFRWANGISRDRGDSWESTWTMEFTRRPQTAPGLWNGPSMTTNHCPEDDHRVFDPLLGEWTGVRRDSSGHGTPVRLHLVRILEGCAVMQRTRAEDGAREAFAVRAFEPGAGRWVEYAVASDRRQLHRRTAEPGSALQGLTFTDGEAAAGAYFRTRWRLENGGVRLVEESGPDAGGPWRLVAETRLTARVGRAGG